MNQITVTLDLTNEALDAIRLLTDALNKKTPETPYGQTSLFDQPEEPTAKKEKTSRAAKPKAEAPEAKAEPPAITFTDLRAKALAFSQNERQAELKALLDKYGIKKLSELPEEKFAAFLADVEAANG